MKYLLVIDCPYDGAGFGVQEYTDLEQLRMAVGHAKNDLKLDVDVYAVVALDPNTLKPVEA